MVVTDCSSGAFKAEGMSIWKIEFIRDTYTYDDRSHYALEASYPTEKLWKCYLMPNLRRKLRTESFSLRKIWDSMAQITTDRAPKGVYLDY